MQQRAKRRNGVRDRAVHKITLRRGAHRLHGRGRGDLLAILRVQVPTKLDDADAELLRRYAEQRGEDVAPPESGFFSRIKSAFS